MRTMTLTLGMLCLGIQALTAAPAAAAASCAQGTLTGPGAIASGWREDRPGQCRLITLPDLPPPGNVSPMNPPNVMPRPAGFLPVVPPGFAVSLAYADATRPSGIAIAPNGDIFMPEDSAHQLRVLRPDGAGGFSADSVFAGGLNAPYGIAFYPPGAHPTWIYVAETTDILRFPYVSGDLTARGASQTIVANLPTGGHGDHDIAFSPDGKSMFVSVGSLSDDQANGENETGRAQIRRYSPDGTFRSVYATGLRNPKPLGIEPRTGKLWTSVNERNQLGDDLVPDFVTTVAAGQDFGWSNYYLSVNNVDPSRGPLNPPPVITTPDLLVQAHSASLGFSFYRGTGFPAAWRGAYVAEHGSVSRGYRTGSKLIFVPIVGGGRPGATYEDFMTGFTLASAATADGSVTYGRPAGVVTGLDGALYVVDDVGNAVWRVTYQK